MTKEEEVQFIQAVRDSIMPYAQNMTETQIKALIESVEQQNQNLPFGFGSMLFDEIMKIKKGENS